MTAITKVCVIGAGVMGSGIAAQIANSGTKVLLLDIASKDKDRSSIARAAVAKMQVTKPPPLSHPKRAELISIGNLEDDLEKIKTCEFVIEVIVEKLDVKHNLYSKILPYLHPEAILASNTSTFPLHKLKENLPRNVAKRFSITHFFNPPRYMRLLELITDKTTDKNATEVASSFIERRLGKSIVPCNDTPGFIANRIGCFLLELVLRKALEHNLAVEVVDQIMIKELTLPSTGIFGLYDLIGIDVMNLIAKSLTSDLPRSDRFVEIYSPIPLIEKMIADGYTGRKGLGGFYRMREDKGAKVKEVLNLKTGQYGSLNKDPEAGMTDNYKKAVKEILSEFESYVRSLVPEVTSVLEDIDRAMKLGYSWKKGPFELFGTSASSRAHVSGRSDPVRLNVDSPPPEIATVATLLRDDARVICDIGTKMNVLTEDAFNRLIEAVSAAESTGKPLYIYSESPNFSAGADLKFLYEKIDAEDWEAIDEYLKLGQKAMMAVKYSRAPVISCAKGVALGGGCELLLHSHFVVANQQLNAGLVEVSLGLIPAFGGTKEMILRSGGDKALLEKLLGNIMKQNKSTSADYFAEDYMVPTYVNMNLDYLLEEAVTQKMNMAHKSNNKCQIPVFVLDDSGLESHEKVVAQELMLLGASTLNEQELLDMERKIFIKLAQTPIVKEKIKKIFD